MTGGTTACFSKVPTHADGSLAVTAGGDRRGSRVDRVEAVSSLTERVCLDPLQQLQPRLPSAGSCLFNTLCGARPEL